MPDVLDVQSYVLRSPCIFLADYYRTASSLFHEEKSYSCVNEKSVLVARTVLYCTALSDAGLLSLRTYVAHWFGHENVAVSTYVLGHVQRSKPADRGDLRYGGYYHAYGYSGECDD